VVGDATLNRFFSFHVIAVPLVLLGLVVAHLLALHDVGSNNPDGVEIEGPMHERRRRPSRWMACPFHPYYTVHDIFMRERIPDGVHCHHVSSRRSLVVTSWSTTTSFLQIR